MHPTKIECSFTITYAVITAQKTITMKTLKTIFSLLTLTLILSSCSPQAMDDEQNTNAVEDTQSRTGDETESTHNGSKDTL